MRELLRKDPPASGTEYGPHYAIRFTHKEMVPTPVVLAETPEDTAQLELPKDNPFASRSMVTSATTLPTKWQAGCDAEGDPPRASGNLLKDPRRALKVVVEHQLGSSTDPQESPMKEPSTATL